MQTATQLDILLIQIIDGLGIIVANIFVYCYFGNLVTIKLAEIADASYSMLWYKYPLQQQKYVILLLVRAQRPFYLTGYFRTSCTLERFTGVSISDLIAREQKFWFKIKYLFDNFVDFSYSVFVFYGTSGCGVKTRRANNK